MFLIYTSRLLVSRALNHVDFTKIQLISLLSLFLVCVCVRSACALKLQVNYKMGIKQPTLF